ncbi:MAG: FkbM family methyltransferase [Candidatus Omnitrophica bacterium]|nr:FkbM family methyltransferase [Candidatus Omnitrophota bacterium]
MGLKRVIFDGFMKVAVNILCLKRANKLSCGIAEYINPVYSVKRNGIEYRFSCPNEVTLWRAQTFFTKEPETIEWIDTFNAGDTLFDIGANVGLYSIYAAKKGVKVVAFEPESQNYALLNKNVFLNDLQDAFTCLNLAVGSRKSLDYIYLPSFFAGCAMNTFGSSKDEEGKEFKPAHKQGVMAYSLDLFLAEFKDKFPTHIKIDVDGLEPQIIRGADNTLNDRRLKSISLELNEAIPEHLNLIGVLKEKGFKLLHKKHAPMFDNTKYQDYYNYLFIRAE